MYEDIPGGKELLAFFGTTPSFHDGEIVGVSLNRSGESTLQVHGWTISDKLNPDRSYILDKQAVVTFTFLGITDLELNGFSPQNVIAGLILQQATDRGRSDFLRHSDSLSDMEVELRPCYGLEGFIRAQSIVISFRPGPPPKDKL